LLVGYSKTKIIINKCLLQTYDFGKTGKCSPIEEFTNSTLAIYTHYIKSLLPTVTVIIY